MVPTPARLKKSMAHGPLVTTPMPLLEMSEKISLDAKERLCIDVLAGLPWPSICGDCYIVLPFPYLGCWTGWGAGETA